MSVSLVVEAVDALHHVDMFENIFPIINVLTIELFSGEIKYLEGLPIASSAMYI